MSYYAMFPRAYRVEKLDGDVYLAKDMSTVSGLLDFPNSWAFYALRGINVSLPIKIEDFDGKLAMTSHDLSDPLYEFVSVHSVLDADGRGSGYVRGDAMRKHILMNIAARNQDLCTFVRFAPFRPFSANGAFARLEERLGRLPGGQDVFYVKDMNGLKVEGVGRK